MSGHRGFHRFSVAQLRHPLVQFGGLIGLHVGVDHLDDFASLGGDLAGAHRSRDGANDPLLFRFPNRLNFGGVVDDGLSVALGPLAHRLT